MDETILVLNSGSSSIKFQLFAIAAGERLERRHIVNTRYLSIQTVHARAITVEKPRSADATA
jgi:acetate kinase